MMECPCHPPFCLSGKKEKELPHNLSSLGVTWSAMSRREFFFEVYPSCGRSLALARCHRGGSPRASPRAASSPRDALATPHPGKRNDRAPPPPASPHRAAPRLASPRLAAAHAHTHPRARARSARAKQPSKRVPNREPKGPGSNREPVRPPPLAVLAKASKAVLDITREIVRAREILTRPTVPSRRRSRAARARTRRPRALPPPPPRKLTG